MSRSWHDDDDFWGNIYEAFFPAAEWAEASREVGLLIELVGAAAGSSTLDLACGPGRHSLELARRGHRVTGVDRTGAYLALAREKAQAESLDIEFVQADMREFVRADSFDLAINLYSSFGYFLDPADDRRVLANIFQSLKPGGFVVLEMMGKEVLAAIFRPRDVERLDDGTLWIQERWVTRNWSWLLMRWTLVRGGETREFLVEHRLYSGTELEELLGQVGFVPVRIYGYTDGRPYDHAARRLVAVAQKPAGVCSK